MQKEIGAWKLRFSREWMTENKKDMKGDKDRMGSLVEYRRLSFGGFHGQAYNQEQ